MPKPVIYHNPRCSKSRQTLALLEEHGHAPQVIEYLKAPPSAAELQAILKKLKMKPRDLMRKGEDVYKSLGLDNEKLTDEKLLRAMVENPILIERPIVVMGAKARIGRPPESVLELF
ncbi:arsenate reductase (glutaredoxin) [uncultured Parvibaculum sp.]|uniref:arsenate reductase (glutaredoxin) n=1 Tax=uncultured Parvibaculum sp. TaxID=291828 RepID=UPI0030D71268|tara:strand:- start:95922 stop:96272 length:351 start_codon:yes stop_codon:yes gene_type:complete